MGCSIVGTSGSGATMMRQRREFHDGVTRWKDVAADRWPLWAMVVVALSVLGVMANAGVGRFIDRAHGPTDAEVAQLAQLSCIQRTVDLQTTPGESVNVDADPETPASVDADSDLQRVD